MTVKGKIGIYRTTFFVKINAAFDASFDLGEPR